VYVISTSPVGTDGAAVVCTVNIWYHVLKLSAFFQAYNNVLNGIAQDPMGGLLDAHIAW
jgi:hypothetical protein